MAFDNIKLDKGLYTSGKGFTAMLEQIDPSENYKGTQLEGLDAYQRQLKRFDIKVSGSNSDCVEKFFKTSDSAALFPEYISRAVQQGMEEANILADIVATTTKIDSLDYRTISSIPTEEDKELVEVAEGAHIPETVIRTKDKLVKLNKRGRMLVASYEAIRFQKLDLFTVTLRQIGSYIARSQMKDAIKVLSDALGEESKVTASESLKYADLVKLWDKFDPYTLTTMIATPDLTMQLLQLEEFKDSFAGQNFHATGALATPFGAKLMKNKNVPANHILALDKNCALEMVQAGEVVTDFDKLIDRQLERAAITSIAGFSAIMPDAIKALEVE